jgi:DNA-binding transcriptional ArsR family regulator
MTKTLIKSNLEEYARLFLSLGDKTRLKLLSLMANEPVSVGFLVDELGESQPKVSRHLAYLRNSGVVNTKRDGKWIYYGIQQSDDPDIDRVVKFVIQTLLGVTPGESTYVKKSRQSKTQIEDTAEEIEVAKTDEASYYQETQEAEQEAEEEEFFVENESSDDELEVFLL